MFSKIRGRKYQNFVLCFERLTVEYIFVTRVTNTDAALDRKIMDATIKAW